MASWSLGDPEFTGTSALREYLGKARTLIRPLASELHIAAEELRAVLKEAPGGSAYLMGTDQKVRARLVASHLITAAEGVEYTCAGLVRTYASFQKHFLTPELTAKTKRKAFDVNN